MKKSELFRAAKKYLAETADAADSSNMILNIGDAISSAYYSNSNSVSALIAESCIRTIKDRLGSAKFLSGWLLKMHGIDAFSDKDKYQETRHAWLDSLIKEFEAKGD
jgi:hypothetical protein